MGWWILFGLMALAAGALVAVTTFGCHISKRKPGESFFAFELTIVWPSGPVTYRWPRDGK